jgi:hypothetical protein
MATATARVTLENVNHPGKTTTADADKYEATRKAMLKVLPARAPGLTVEETYNAILPHLPNDLFPHGAKAGWWCKAVQLDLEAKKLITREPVTPLRLHRGAK